MQNVEEQKKRLEQKKHRLSIEEINHYHLRDGSLSLRQEVAY